MVSLLDDPGGGGRVRLTDASLPCVRLDFAVQFVAFDVGNDFAVEADFGAGIRRRSVDIDLTGVGQDGADAVAQRVVSVAYGGALAVVDGGFADEAVEFVVGEFDAAVLVAGFGQVAGNRVVFETGAADAFVFALSVAAGDFAALFSISWPRMLRLNGGCAKFRDGLSDDLYRCFGRIRSVGPVVRRHRSRRQ